MYKKCVDETQCINFLLYIPKATCTRTRVFSKTELFDPRYRNGHTYPELFENALASKRRFRIRFFVACEHGIRIFSATVSKDQNWLAQAINIASRACAVSLPKLVATHLFLFRRELPSKTKR